MIRRTTFSCLTAFALLQGSAVFAAAPLQIDSDVFVERRVAQPNGAVKVVLEAPKMVTPGDNLVFVIHYRNVGSQTARDFTVTNPLPAAVIFNGTTDGLEAVSVDGGRSWGTLAQLKITGSDGTSRPARMSDVTDVRWNVNQPLTAGAEGKLIFRGVVR